MEARLPGFRFLGFVAVLIVLVDGMIPCSLQVRLLATAASAAATAVVLFLGDHVPLEELQLLDQNPPLEARCFVNDSVHKEVFGIQITFNVL